MSAIPAPAKVDWQTASGESLNCAEKRKLLDESLQDILSQYRDYLDDALLMGCGEENFRRAVLEALKQTPPTVKERA